MWKQKNHNEHNTCHSSAMDEPWHVQQLQCHCHVYGNRLRKSETGYTSREFEYTSLATTIKATFNVGTSTDNIPTHICRQCYNAVQKQQLAIRAGNTTVHCISLFDWEAHCDNCRVNEYTQKGLHH
jgi:hypothetical protein